MVDELAPPTSFSPSGTSRGLPVDEATMYADHKGSHHPRTEKKQKKLLEAVSFLGDFLEEGEQLKAITTAVSPTSLFEQWTTGLAFLYLKRCLLVFTDRRIFHIPTSMDFAYRESIAQIRYGDVESIAQKGSQLRIDYKSGKKEKFLYLRGSERKKIKALLENVELTGASGQTEQRVHLCPTCRSELEAERYDCGSCGREFKNRSKALKLSLWLPGGGYFYTGHPFLGIADAAFEAFFLLVIVMGMVAAAGGAAAAYAGVLVFVVILAIEKAITVYHANHFIKEYLPVDPAPVKSGPLRTTMKWAAMVFTVLFVGLAIFGTLMDTGTVPSDRVLATQELPDNQYQELLAEGIIADDEVVELFYSEGLLSITEGGSVLTDRRLIAYAPDENGVITIWEIPNDRIASITLVQQGDATAFSIYRVSTGNEDEWIDLWLPHEYGDGERFAAAVQAKIVD